MVQANNMRQKAVVLVHFPFFSFLALFVFFLDEMGLVLLKGKQRSTFKSRASGLDPCFLFPKLLDSSKASGV